MGFPTVHLKGMMSDDGRFSGQWSFDHDFINKECVFDWTVASFSNHRELVNFFGVCEGNYSTGEDTFEETLTLWTRESSDCNIWFLGGSGKNDIGSFAIRGFVQRDSFGERTVLASKQYQVFSETCSSHELEARSQAQLWRYKESRRSLVLPRHELQPCSRNEDGSLNLNWSVIVSSNNEKFETYIVLSKSGSEECIETPIQKCRRSESTLTYCMSALTPGFYCCITVVRSKVNPRLHSRNYFSLYVTDGDSSSPTVICLYYQLRGERFAVLSTAAYDAILEVSTQTKDGADWTTIATCEVKANPSFHHVQRQLPTVSRFLIKVYPSDSFGRLNNENCSVLEYTDTVCSECVICSETFETENIISPDCCSHVFHAQCLENWAAIKNECPLCRQSFNHTCDVISKT